MKWLQLLILFCFVTPVIAKDCNDLSNLNLDKIAVTETSLVKINVDLASFCKVKGVINPNIGFEARLPDKNWNGKFFQAEDGIRDFCLSRGLGDVYKRQEKNISPDQKYRADIQRLKIII